MNNTEFSGCLRQAISFAFDNEMELKDHFFPGKHLGDLDYFYMAGERCIVRFEMGVSVIPPGFYETTIGTAEYLSWKSYHQLGIGVQSQ